MVSGQERVTIIDMFCGCGGNAIAFALKKEVKLVVCVDTDVAKLKMAARNAKIYGITKEKMLFIHSGACKVLSCYNGGVRSNDINDINLNSNWGDFSSDFKFGELDLLPDSIEMAFISPPWGGMDYVKVGKRNYTLQCIQIEEESERMNGEVLLERAACALGHKATACFFPKNINGIAVGKSSHKAGFEGPVVMEQNILNGKLKTVTAYLGMS
jgi:trimethylguanosine synthase